MPATKAIAVTYVPADVGSIIPGKSKAPQAFRDVGIIDKLRDAGVSSITEHYALDEPITYVPTKFLPGSVRNENLNVSVCQSVKESLTKSLSLSATEPPFQLVLGGECCMLPAILSAFWQQSRGQRIGLIYIDADTDLSSPIDPGTTGIFAGMNMTHLVQSAGSLENMKQFSRPNGDPVCDLRIWCSLAPTCHRQGISVSTSPICSTIISRLSARCRYPKNQNGARRRR
jgi:arginase